jgi:hypothetical protein
MERHMAAFDFATPAELFPSKRNLRAKGAVTYRRFDTAADAIRYAVEELPPQYFAGTYLEVDEERFDGEGIRKLYESPDYPLPRRDPKF